MVFERFDPQAKQVVVIAQESARQHRQGAISPVHLVLGALGQAHAGVAQLLAGSGSAPVDAVARVEAIALVGDQDLDGHIPMSSGTKVAIRAAVAAADARSHDRITPVHVLAGCLVDPQPALAQVLNVLGITAEAVDAVLDVGPGGGIHFSGVEPI